MLAPKPVKTLPSTQIFSFGMGFSHAEDKHGFKSSKDWTTKGQKGGENKRKSYQNPSYFLLCFCAGCCERNWEGASTIPDTDQHALHSTGGPQVCWHLWGPVCWHLLQPAFPLHWPLPPQHELPPMHHMQLLPGSNQSCLRWPDLAMWPWPAMLLWSPRTKQEDMKYLLQISPLLF